MLAHVSPLGVCIYSCPTKGIASLKWCSKMQEYREMTVPLVNTKTTVPSNHHTQANNSGNSFYILHNNLASPMPHLFIILPSLGLARGSTNQYMHYGTRSSQRELFEKLSNKISQPVPFCSFIFMHSLLSYMSSYFLDICWRKKKKPARLLIQKHPSGKKKRRRRRSSKIKLKHIQDALAQLPNSHSTSSWW